MKNTKIFMKASLSSCFLFLSVHNVSASLLEDSELERGNYALVRKCDKHKFVIDKDKKSVGHASLQIYKRGSLFLTASLYPDIPVNPYAHQTVAAYWLTTEQDSLHKPDSVVKLYSLNLARIEQALADMKEKNTYSMISTGGSDAVFAFDNEHFSRNCASAVRDLLNAGGLRNLFERPLDQSRIWVAGSVIRHGVPGAAKTAIEIAAAGVGGVFGGFIGGAFGALSRENPFKSAAAGMKSGAVTGARAADFLENAATGAGSSEHFSALNYGHLYGECSIVTPRNVLQLAQDASAQEQKKFPKVAAW